MLTAILNFPMDRMAPTVVLESVLFIYRCDICSATFNLQKNLALHVAAHQTENLICPGEHFTGRVYTHNTYRYLLLIQSNYAFADRLIFSKVGIKILLWTVGVWCGKRERERDGGWLLNAYILYMVLCYGECNGTLFQQGVPVISIVGTWPLAYLDGYTWEM